METYTPNKIEKKWQKKWQKLNLNRAADPGEPGSEKPKCYTLVEFPYPSGAGLHVGHVRAWSGLDAYVRKKRMEGYSVLFPMGWDAFGLPAENYALKQGVHPSITTAQNIANFRRQIQALGLSFDWSREISTTDPGYYRWTQWIFLKLLEQGLAYQSEVPVNWCPFCKTNLADEEVLPDGIHERCGTLVEKRLQKQWLLRITKYADRLIEDLKSVDFPDKVARQQVNWIGRKEGAVIKFEIRNSKFENSNVEVFTTRADTLFGATFLVLAPEHPLITEIISSSVIAIRRPAEKQSQTRSPRGVTPRDDREKLEEVRNYVEAAKKKSEEERNAEGRKKTGVFTGIYAINPATGKEIPVWVADYVLSSYGTGAIMAVPAHDDRDLEFAREYELPIIPVVSHLGDLSDLSNLKEPYEGEGTLINSGPYNGQSTQEARQKIVADLAKKGLARATVTYHLHDWIFSRQHYWGEPIPVIYCHNCLEKSKIKNQKSKIMTTVRDGVEYAIVPVPEKDLPVELPFVEKYEPSGTGESPLATMTDWVNTICPQCSGPAKRETDTMPNWAGSNWYYLAYLFADKLGNQKSNIKNQKDSEPARMTNANIFTANKDLIDYWMPVNVYEGGYEHTTLHLLYSRFIYKFLYDIKVVPTPEPYASRRVHGIVLGPDGRKMSKSFGNVINPDEIVSKFGADTLRMYEMFMGPYGETVVWNMNGVVGVYRFLGRIWTLFQSGLPESALRALSDSGSLEVQVLLSRLAKKVSSDLESLKFNTAVSAFMEFVNKISNFKFQISNSDWEIFLRILAPLVPHLAEELYQRLQVSVIASTFGKLSAGSAKQSLANAGQGAHSSEIATGRTPPPAGALSTRPHRYAKRFRQASDWRAGRDDKDFVSVHEQPWPKIDIEESVEDVDLVVQVNSKVRDVLKMSLERGREQAVVQEAALGSEKVKKHLNGKDYKVVFVPGKLINFVTRGK